MSRTLSAMLQTEGHIGVTAPSAAPPPQSTTAHVDPVVTSARRPRRASMRRFVVQAIEAPDLATKLELWACYRSARADALAMMGDSPGTSGIRRSGAS